MLLRGCVTARVGRHTARFHLERKEDFHFLVAIAWRVFDRQQLETLLSRIRETDVIYEIGGHVGTWSVFIAQAAARGHLYVFEPEPFNARQLNANIKLNKLENVTHVGWAASNANGEAEFGVGKGRGEGTHSLVITHEHAQTLKVRTVRLDGVPSELSIARPSVMKIDCEGAEGLVLEGAGELLDGVRVLQMELHHGQLEQTGYTAEQVIEMVTSRGLRVVSQIDWGPVTHWLFER